MQLYNTEVALLTPLYQYVSEGLKRNDTVIVVATPQHRTRLHERLLENGIDAEALAVEGRYIVKDAATTLTQFMRFGMPDRALYMASVGRLIAQAENRGRPVRAFGEMVALLWDSGNKDAVIKLENLWNELGSMHTFSLFCAYPELHFITYGEELDQIISCHDLHYIS